MRESGKGESIPFLNLFGLEPSKKSEDLRIKKSSGRIEPFLLKKLTTSINNAFSSVGESNPDTAYSLAVAIKAYLRDVYGSGALVSSKKIFDMTSLILEDMGFTKVARVYQEYERLKKLKNTLYAKGNRELIEKLHARNSFLDEDSIISVNAISISKIIDDICDQAEIRLSDDYKKGLITRVKEILLFIRPSSIQPSLGFIRELCTLVLSADGYEPKELEGLISIDINLKNVLKTISKYDKEKSTTPTVSSSLIGDIIKEEVAREFIFSEKVLKALKDGKIYFSQAKHIDRFDFATFPVYCVWNWKGEIGNNISSPDDFLKRLLEMSDKLCDFFSSYIEWWGINVILAPLLKGFEGREYEDWMIRFNQSLCANFKTYKSRVYFTIDWDIPDCISSLPVRGSGGKSLGTEYSKYLETARQHFWDFLANFVSYHTKTDNPGHFIWRFNPNTDVIPSQGVWVLVSSAVENEGIPLRFRFEPISNGDISSKVVLFKVVVDVAQLYLGCSNEEELFLEFYNTVVLAIEAYEEYLSFLYRCKELFGETVWDRLFPLLTIESKGNMGFESFPLVISLAGIEETIKLLALCENPGTLELFRRMQYLVGRFRKFINSISKDKNIKIRLAYDTDYNFLKFGSNIKFFSSPKFSDYIDELIKFRNVDKSHILSLEFCNLEDFIVKFDEFLNLVRYFDLPVKVALYPVDSFDSFTLTDVMNYIFSTARNFSVTDNPFSFEIFINPRK